MKVAAIAPESKRMMPEGTSGVHRTSTTEPLGVAWIVPFKTACIWRLGIRENFSRRVNFSVSTLPTNSLSGGSSLMGMSEAIWRRLTGSVTEDNLRATSEGGSLLTSENEAVRMGRVGSGFARSNVELPLW